MENCNGYEADRDIGPLVEAPIESPLNLAHSFSRKGDMLTRQGKFEEAIDGHRRAAEYLLIAMSTSENQALLDSMSLQHRLYVEKIDKLTAKIRLMDMVEGAVETITTVSCATQTDDLNNVDTNQLIAVNESTVCQILRENDDVMSQLLQSTDQSNPATQSAYLFTPDSPTKMAPFMTSAMEAPFLAELHPLCRSVLAAQKIARVAPSDDTPQQTTITPSEESLSFESLVKMNARLSAAVKGLLGELQTSRRELRHLRKEREEHLKHRQPETLEFSGLELPPLEISYPELGDYGPLT